MVIIRLARAGAKKRPFYNIRVADSRKPRDGAYLERVGYFNPNARGKEERLVVDIERTDKWLALGAQASDRVKRLIKDFKLGEEVVAQRRTAKLEKKRQRKEAANASKKNEALNSAGVGVTGDEVAAGE